MFQPWMILAILPEIGLVLLAALVLAFDLRWHGKKAHRLGWLTAGGLLVLMALSLIFARPSSQPLIFGGMLRMDSSAFIFRMVFLMGAALTTLFTMDRKSANTRGEFFGLLITATLGMCLMAASADLVMLYLAIETTSIPLYILAGYLIRDQKSTESGLKYFLYGAVTSTVMLYGFSLLFGFAGTTQIYAIANQIKSGSLPVYLPIMAALLIVVGFGFKVSAVPFHFWAPDVYEGAPTPVTGFLSTASKAAGFSVLIRFFLAVFPEYAPTWIVMVSGFSAASMILGNVVAITQKNIKRLLAYSSIAQAGYILIGVAAGSTLGIAGSIFYLVSYLVTNLAAFGIVELVGRSVGSDSLDAYNGLSRRSPALALALLIALLSLGGIPPFGGFIAKLLVFAAAVKAGLVWLAFVGALTSIAGLYYYLNVLKIVYLYPTPKDSKPLVFTTPWRIGLAICIVGIILLGTVFGPWYSWTSIASTSLF
ncbi:MAG TPA: NADH-quinone oxidoreductase subunit N [Anaerolineaceae bacterium]